MRISDWSSDVCSSDLRWNFGRLDIELGANRIAFAAQRIDQRFQFRQTRRIGAEERILVDARPVATAAMNRADLFDATANLGAELLAQIFLRDRAGSNAHRGLARTRTAANPAIANTVLLNGGLTGRVWSEKP